MVNMVAAQTYGEAIFQLAEEMNILEQMEKELTYIKELLQNVPDLVKFIEAPLLPVEAKIETLEKILKDEVGDYAKHFVYVMLKRNRARCIIAAINQYIEKSRHVRGILTAKVWAARPLSETNEKKLSEKLEGDTGKKVILEVFEKPDLLGGFIVEVGDRRYDASVARRLKDMEKLLLSNKVSTSEIGVNESV